jgi:AraC-like DNA-binding protein
MAEAADDPYLAVYIGEMLDVYSWPVFADAARAASSFGEFILRFSKETANQATSVKYRLETDGDYATFKAQRVFTPDSCPAQADAFYIGLFCKMFQRCTGEAWDPKQVRAQCCDTTTIPKNYQHILVAQGDLRGCTIRFPQEWLLLPFNLEDFRQRVIPTVDFTSPPKSLIEAVHQALLPHIHMPELNNEMAAELCGFETRTLGRKLKAKETTINKEIANLRRNEAIHLLTGSTRSISDIASAVGYQDPSVFTRSFKRWTGMSPREYRKQHKRAS